MAVIYHGTPLTPRDALQSVCSGRAMCVSFYRPDDAEVVEAISPSIMFRQRGFFVLAGGASPWRGMGRASGLATLFRVVGAPPVPAGTVGGHPRYAGGAIPAQRCTAQRMAVRSAWRAPLAHGWTDREVATPMRAVRSGVPGLDWAEGRIAGLSREDVRGRSGARKPLAGSAHASRDSGCLRLPFRQRGQHIARAERVAI